MSEPPRESLPERIGRLRKERWLYAAVLLVIVAAWFSPYLLTWFAWVEKDPSGLVGGIATLAVPIAVLLIVWVGVAGLKDQSVKEERSRAALEVVMEERRDTGVTNPEAARIVGGDCRALDEALYRYQVACGKKVWPRFERLSRHSHGELIDACVRLAEGREVYCFTPGALANLDVDQMLAVLAHLIERGKMLRNPLTSMTPAVLEADARALLVTRDHVGLLRAIEECITNAGRIRSSASEAWFSDNQYVVRTMTGQSAGPEGSAILRIDRLGALRTQLGALGFDVPPTERPLEPQRPADADLIRFGKDLEQALRLLANE